MIITEENYFSPEVQRKYMDVPMFKEMFGTPAREGCEARAMAKLNGEFAEEKGEALLFGSLVDVMLTGTKEELLKFMSDNPNMYASRGPTKGQLKVAYQKAHQMVDRVRQDEKFMKYLDGEHQKIMTGNIFGLDWRIKIDCYIPGKAIVDLKTCESITKAYWSSKTRSRCNFVEYFDYILQGAIYQEIVYQNTGQRLPFYLACISKEEIPDIEIIYIDDKTLHERIYGNEFLEGIADQVEIARMLLNKEVTPTECGRCKYCLPKKVIKRPIHYLEIGGDID
jgi:hypothetical protein